MGIRLPHSSHRIEIDTLAHFFQLPHLVLVALVVRIPFPMAPAICSPLQLLPCGVYPLFAELVMVLKLIGAIPVAAKVF